MGVRVNLWIFAGYKFSFGKLSDSPFPGDREKTLSKNKKEWGVELTPRFGGFQQVRLPDNPISGDRKTTTRISGIFRRSQSSGLSKQRILIVPNASDKRIGW